MTDEGGPIRILHVEDDGDFADLVETLLERENDRFHVEIAHNADGGMRHIQDNQVHCIISDYDMPGKNGIEFLEDVRSEQPNLPFILYTGKGSEEIASEAISAGVTDYLQKTAGTSQYDILANRVENAVEQYRSQKAATRAERRLEALSQATNDVLWLFTADWSELKFVNSAYEDIWGQSIDEMEERSTAFLDGIHPDDRDRVKEAMETLSDGNPVDIEYRVNPDEEYGRWVWVRGFPLYDDEGDVSRVAGYARDVTDRKRHERELERQNDRMQDLLTDLAESMRTALEDDEEDKLEECRRRINQIEEIIDHMSSLTSYG